MSLLRNQPAHDRESVREVLIGAAMTGDPVQRYAQSRRDGMQVNVVASAGGLEALTEALQALPTDLTAAIVVQQHLSARPSQLVPILELRTGHAVAWAHNGVQLQPGRVLVAPARRALEFLPDGTCAVGNEVLQVRDRPHDAFLTSLADAHGDHALAVVLTGMGSDGATGVRALLEVGAGVLVQSVETAEHPGMPQAAAEAGAELMLPLHELGGVIADVVQGAPMPRPGKEIAAVRATFGDTGQIAELAEQVDWSTTPVGRVSEWPSQLRLAVQLAMDTPTPTAVMWGTDHFLFLNEAAVEPLGGRHRQAFGRPHRDAFPKMWGQMGPLLDAGLCGERPVVPTLRLPFEQGGTVLDAWFDLSHTPIRGDDGAIVGVLESFFDRTTEVLASRRLQTLNGLAATPAAGTRRRALENALDGLAADPEIPFAAAYLGADTSGRVRAGCGAGRRTHRHRSSGGSDATARRVARAA